MLQEGARARARGGRRRPHEVQGRAFSPSDEMAFDNNLDYCVENRFVSPHAALMRALLHERVPPHVTRRPNAESERAVEEDEEQRDREQEFRADEHERYREST